MYDYLLEEMADAIAKELHVENNDVLSVLNQFWQDKIAHVWQASNILEIAINMGKPITRTDAMELLHAIFENHDSQVGISWASLEIELQEYHLTLKSLSEKQHNEVYGVFKVWRQGNPIAHQFGLFPDMVIGNLPKALEFAKSMADELPNVQVLIGCERQRSDQVEPWLSVLREKDELLVNESEASCTPLDQNNASAS